MRKSSSNARRLFSLAAIAVASACSAKDKPRGELMIVVSADVSIPKDMNQVVVEVLTDDGNKQSFTYPILPEDLGKPMPGTLAIVPPNAGGQHVRVRLIAERDPGTGAPPTPRVVREATLNVPTDRVAMLPMPLRWLCDGHSVPTPDGSYQSDCGPDETCAAGKCVTAVHDAAKLLAYDPRKVFGGGDENGMGGVCMDVLKCFADAIPVVPDADCTLAMPTDATLDKLNIAMLPANGDGFCTMGSGAQCFIPLDNDADEGWTMSGGRIVLPQAVCTELAAGKIQSLALTTACATKDGSVPLCGPWTTVGSGEPPGAGGGTGGTGGTGEAGAAQSGGNGGAAPAGGNAAQAGSLGVSGSGGSGASCGSWRLAVPSRMNVSAMVYDSARRTTLAFGGNDANGDYGRGTPVSDTLEWDGTRWTRLSPATIPPARTLGAMAYDSVRQRAVAFGGAAFGSHALGDTWEWDGADWAQRSLGAGPAARQEHAMAYDSIRHKTVLFGGSTQGFTGVFSDTWVWDGAAWAQLAPPVSPTPRISHAMAFDVGRGKVVLFGGWSDGNYILGDTWEFDGTTWAQLSPTVSPPPRAHHAMVYDSARAKVLLFGGEGNGPDSYDTWEWNGVTWTQLVPSVPTVHPEGRLGAGMSYDSDRHVAVVFGGNPTNAIYALYGDTWEWNGMSWTLAAGPNSPPPLYVTGMAHDAAHAKTILFGGATGDYVNETWAYDGTAWSHLAPPTSPSARAGHAMAYDEARQNILLFSGGQGTSSDAADTWTWSGTTWKQLSPATSPPAREDHAMAYDPARARIVLFGGIDAGGVLADTWEWDGITWQQMMPMTSPEARSGHAMAYDGARSKIVLFGGLDGQTYLADTWEWDGTNWMLASQGTAATALAGSNMIFAPLLGKVVRFGGQAYSVGGGNEQGDTFTWDGTQWTRLALSAHPDARHLHAMAYDQGRNSIVLYGGYSDEGDTWEFNANACADGAP